VAISVPVSDQYIDFARDLLADFEPLWIRRMFGGAGVYAGERFFAILVDDTLYLKVDEDTRAQYEQRGLLPFSYETKTGRKVSMSYYPAPPEALEEREALKPWVRGALEAAGRALRDPAAPTGSKAKKVGITGPPQATKLRGPGS
jgi:DNA transformation protein